MITHLKEVTAIKNLQENSTLITVLLEHPLFSIEIYKPNKVDLQTPHTRDEFYWIISGKGKFELEGEMIEFEKGDIIFVPAGADHRFKEFTENFITWVIFLNISGKN